MATIEVDIGFFIFVTLIGLFALPFLIGWTLWKSYKNPEFWLKLRRQQWVYALVLNPLNKLVQLAVPLNRIGEDGEMTLFKNRKYFWPDTALIKVLKEGGKVDPSKTKPDDEIVARRVFDWRHNKPAALFQWNDPFAQVWAPGNTIFSITTPDKLDDIMDLKILKMMMNADSMTKLMQLALVISIIGILAIGGVAFGLYSVTSSVNHQSCILLAGNNATLAAACH